MKNPLPTLPKPAYFIAECVYSWGGENHINILVKTDVDVAKLLKLDLCGYIGFIKDNLVDYFDFANFMDDSEIFSIADIERNKDESFEHFMQRIFSTISLDTLKTIQDGGAIDICINRHAPSSFSGFRSVSDEDAAILENHMPQAQVIPLV